MKQFQDLKPGDCFVTSDTAFAVWRKIDDRHAEEVSLESEISSERFQQRIVIDPVDCNHSVHERRASYPNNTYPDIRPVLIKYPRAAILTPEEWKQVSEDHLRHEQAYTEIPVSATNYQYYAVANALHNKQPILVSLYESYKRAWDAMAKPLPKEYCRKGNFYVQ